MVSRTLVLAAGFRKSKLNKLLNFKFNKLSFSFLRCLWLRKDNNGLSNHKHITSATQNYTLRAPNHKGM